jgi:hypothetical protein
VITGLVAASSAHLPGALLDRRMRNRGFYKESACLPALLRRRVKSTSGTSLDRYALNIAFIEASAETLSNHMLSTLSLECYGHVTK